MRLGGTGVNDFSFSLRRDRAVSLVIGLVFLLGLAVLALSVFQVNFVPESTFDAEVQDKNQAEESMQILEEKIQTVSTRGFPMYTVMDMGVEYPNRVVLLNPPTRASTINTSPSTVDINNIKALDNETSHFWGGERSFESSVLTYIPRYNQYQDASEVSYGNSLVYNYLGDGRSNGNFTLTDQSLIRRDRIELMLLKGSLKKSGTDPSSLSVEPVSTGGSSILVTNEGNKNINLSIETKLSAKNWSSALSNQLDEKVTDVSEATRDGFVNLTLEKDSNYSLSISKVGIDVGGDTTAKYITNVAGNNSTIAADTVKKLSSVVRDKYNNPVSGVNVTAGVTDGGGTILDSDNRKFTDSSGRVRFRYLAPSSGTDARIEMNFSSSPDQLEKNAVFYVTSSTDLSPGEEALADLTDLSVVPDRILDDLESGTTNVEESKLSGDTSISSPNDYILKDGADGKLKDTGSSSGSAVAVAGTVDGKIKDVQDAVLSDGSTVDGKIKDTDTVLADGTTTVGGKIKETSNLNVNDSSSLTVDDKIKDVSENITVGQDSTLTVDGKVKDAGNITLKNDSTMTVDGKLKDIGKIIVGENSTLNVDGKVKDVTNVTLKENATMTVGAKMIQIDNLKMEANSLLDVEDELTCGNHDIDSTATVQAGNDKCT